MGCGCRRGASPSRALRQEPTASRGNAVPVAPKPVSKPPSNTLASKVSALAVKTPKLSAYLVDLFKTGGNRITDEDVRNALEKARLALPEYEEAIMEVLR
jgi:hypothetical protein